MKTATLPSIRVEPELRLQLEAVLHEHESLSQFVEASVIESLKRRQNQAEFIARGIASLDRAKTSGEYVGADEVIDGLERKLGAALAKRGQQSGKH